MDEINPPETEDLWMKDEDLWMNLMDRDIFLDHVRSLPDVYTVDEWDLNDDVGRLMDSALEFTVTHKNWVGHVARYGSEWVLYVKDQERNDGLLDMVEAYHWIQRDPEEAPDA